MRQTDDTLISIVVPVYNAEGFLQDTIRFVQAQTYTNWELLLVDDRSADNSYVIAVEKSKEDARIRPFLQEVNGGAANARNRGIKEARGRYLCFLDADDIWLPDKLKQELTFMQKIKAGFVFMGYEFADELGNGLGKVVHVPRTISYRQALKNTTIFTSTVMFDLALIKREDIMMPLIPSEDTATWWHILKTYGEGAGLDCNLVKYRRSANTLSSNKIVAIKRIWNLYRHVEKLSWIESMYCMFFWAMRAVLRRV